MKLNAKNITISATAGSILSYAAALNHLQAGSMLVGSILGTTILYANHLQKQLENQETVTTDE